MNIHGGEDDECPCDFCTGKRSFEPTPPAPDAYLIRVTRKGRTTIQCGRVYKHLKAAERYAAQATNKWQTCEAVPVRVVGT